MRRLIKDDYAALREVRTAVEMNDAITVLMAAMMKGELTSEQVNAGLRIFRQKLRNVNRIYQEVVSRRRK